MHDGEGNVLPRKAFKGALPSFIQRYVSDNPAMEPQIGFTKDGTAYYPSWLYQAPHSAAGSHHMYLFTSKDRAATWEDVSDELPAMAVPRLHGGGDPITFRDPVTDRFFFGVYTAGCTLLHYTDDAGRSWDVADVCDEGPGTDKPTIFAGPPAGAVTTVGYPNVIYVCYNALVKVKCKRSVDGGTTWVATALPYPQQDFSSGSQTIGFGAASASDGTIYLPRNNGGKAWVAVSRDSGSTWEQVAVGVGAEVGTRAANHGQVAVDGEGNAYYLWLGERHLPTLSVSRDSGKTWSAPIVVAAPGVTAANLPAIAVGRPGRVGFFYIGSTVPNGFEASEEEMAQAVWNGYIGISLDALVESPIFATSLTNVEADPLKRGPCADRCYEYQWGGCIQNGDCADPAVPEGMYDYAGIAISPKDGRIWASFVDLCLESCPQPTPDSEGFSSLGSVAVQVRGPRMSSRGQ